MKTSLKFLLLSVLISSLIIVTTAQNRYRNQRATTNRNRSSNRNRGNNEPIEQGRTLGLLTPLLTLGLGAAARPYVGAVGYDAPIIAPVAYRPRPPASSSGPGSTQSDPYYGGGYPSNYYGGYNNYFGGYPIYRPIAFAGYPVPLFGGYRPPLYPVNYGGYPPYNGYYGQRPSYNNPRPNPSVQRPTAIQQPAINAITSNPSSAVRPPATSGTTTPQINSAQAAQVANLLGQLLGQQLRPLLNPGAAAAAAPANDAPGIAPANLDEKSYRARNYRS